MTGGDFRGALALCEDAATDSLFWLDAHRKERVNIRFTPATGNLTEEIELPFKQVVIGKFNTNVDETPLEDRESVDIDKDCFNSVMSAQNLSLDFTVKDVLSEEEDASMPVGLTFSTLRDFEPEQVVNRVPEVRKLMELRSALLALKGPLGNVPAFRKSVQSILDDDDLRQKLLEELGIAAGDESPDAAGE